MLRDDSELLCNVNLNGLYISIYKVAISRRCLQALDDITDSVQEICVGSRSVFSSLVVASLVVVCVIRFRRSAAVFSIGHSTSDSVSVRSCMIWTESSLALIILYAPIVLCIDLSYTSRLIVLQWLLLTGNVRQKCSLL